MVAAADELANVLGGRADFAVFQRRVALEIELAQGKRANDLRARLTALTDQEAAGAEVDPVVARVTAVTGLPIEALNTWSGVVIAMLLEVLGSLLWVAALAGQSVARQGQPDDADMVERLYAALGVFRAGEDARHGRGGAGLVLGKLGLDGGALLLNGAGLGG